MFKPDLPLQEINLARVWNLVWPILLANISIPLIGATNIAVMGRMPSPVYIGAVALGVIIFQSIYWGFAFLRSGTTGITAQALGAKNYQQVVIALFRSLAIAFILGTLVVLLQSPIAEFSFLLLEGSSEVERYAREYFDVRIWGSYASLGNYALLGWFYGIHKPKLALILRVAMNLLNIPLAIFLALDLKLGVKGTAFSAISSNYVILVIGLIFAFFYIKKLNELDLINFDKNFWDELSHQKQLFQIFKINSDIFIRTIFVLLVFSWFTSLGAKQGDLVLAANAVLINLYWFISYALDSCSNATETLVGQSIGANNPSMFKKALTYSFQIAIFLVACFIIIYSLLGKTFISWLSTSTEVRETAIHYLPWLVFIPLAGIWCFQLDGIFLGSTQTKDMRNMMFIAFAAFVICILTLPKLLGNNGLWLSLYIYLLARAVTLYFPFRTLRKRLFS